MSDEHDLSTSTSSPTIARDTLQVLTAPERRHLRQLLRQRRNALSIAERRVAAARVAQHLRRYILRPGLRIAVYYAFDGEIDLTPTIRVAERLGCVLYAPRIVHAKNRRMEFLRIAPRQRLNPFGMVEPHDRPSLRIDPRKLDIVFTSVIAFDAHGWRLGFGGGYYDRKMAFKRFRLHGPPLFVGVAHAFQQIAPARPARWDVLLDAVVTPDGWQRCHIG